LCLISSGGSRLIRADSDCVAGKCKEACEDQSS
jgi:hypothetical protein